MVKLGDVVNQSSESERNPVAAGLNRVVGLEHIDSDDLHVKRWDDIGDGTSFSKRFRKGQVLFGRRRAYLRKVAYAEFDGICSGDITVLQPKADNLLPELLPFLLQTDGFLAYVLSVSAGGLSPRARWRDLAKYEFPFPPKPEQRRIAEILWAAEGVTERVSECVTGLETLKRTKLAAAFEGNRAPTIPLEDVGKWMSGGTPARNRTEMWSGAFPWVSPKDMKTPLIADTEEHITEEAAKRHSQVAPPGAILLVVRGMILAHTFPVAIAARALAFNQDMKAVIINEGFDRDYVFHWLQHSSRRILNRASESTHGTKRLDTDMLQSLRIPSPPLDSQRELAKVVRQIDLEIAVAHAHAATSRRLGRSALTTLMHCGALTAGQ